MSRTPDDYACQEYSIPVAGRTLRLRGPKYPHALNRDPEVQRRSEESGYKPFWAQPWPTAVMLAEYVIAHVKPGPEPLLELGAGLGLAGIALSLADARVLDWRTPPSEQYALIVASDVAYDPRNHQPLAGLLSKCLRPGGRAFFSDLNRRAADEFPQVLQREGLEVEVVPARARAIPAFDAVDERILNGRVFRVVRT